METYYQTAAKHTGFLFVSLILANLFGYFTRALLSRVISPEEFGLFYSVFTTVLFVGVLTDLGYGNALVKYISHFRALKRYQSIYASIVIVALVKFLLGLSVVGVLMVLAPSLATYYFKHPDAVYLLYITSLWIFLSVVMNLVTNILTGFRKMYSVALLYLGQKALFFIAVLGFALLFQFKNVLMPVYANLIAMFSFVLFFVPLRNCFSKFHMPLHLSKKLFWKLTRFALPSMLNSVGYTFVGYLDVLLLTAYRSLSEVGIYNTVLPTALIITYFATSIALVFLPIASELWAKGSRKRLVQGIQLVYKYGLFIAIPASLLLIFYANTIMGVLFGRSYISGAVPLKILAFGVILVSIFKINTSVLSGIGKPQEATKIILPAAFFNLILNLILIPKYGMVGAAITTTLSYLYMMVASIHKLVYIIKPRFNPSVFFKISINAVIFVVVLLFMNRLLHYSGFLNMLFSSTVAGSIYILCGLLLKIIEPAEFIYVKKQTKR